MLSGRSLCDELITRPEESYRLWCVVVCDLETSRMGAPYTYIYINIYIYIYIYIYDISSLRVKLFMLLYPALYQASAAVQITSALFLDVTQRRLVVGTQVSG